MTYVWTLDELMRFAKHECGVHGDDFEITVTGDPVWILCERCGTSWLLGEKLYDDAAA